MRTPTATVKSSDTTSQAELEAELRRADDDFANGDFVDVTIEEIDRCIVAGEWPWEPASSE